ncbi:hypothetical protein HAX54_007877 [Datura stramonium]|uniref:Uncharacterized protein n=1 Tax=Datura stramonium TaxID=4076 RepID=A0ABS8TD46_DATST|nr:hypothetical protein [Datura stramonium]
MEGNGVVRETKMARGTRVVLSAPSMREGKHRPSGVLVVGCMTNIGRKWRRRDCGAVSSGEEREKGSTRRFVGEDERMGDQERLRREGEEDGEGRWLPVLPPPAERGREG